ncbi:alpha/beta hydrolase [Sphingomonas sp. BT-65]|uniref:alpha/beta hydrolase n=1 Tax=Sphingomonas sp. BT-65 TaxID=2989821 RepID=UPI0022356559|nr:alpha/beta hydrolase [Sphingomonas sp. BT-65]MCW4460161.1 alpha/beta hydrolase [Sphingomonas sp. BT-65]
MAESFVRPDVRAFLDMIAAMPQPEWPPQPAVYRAQYAAMKDLVDLPVGEVATVRDLEIPGPAGAIPARLYDARAARAPGPAVVYFHGGGFVIGDIDTHAGIAAEMARTLDLPVVSVGYRLAPEHPWPAASDDAEAAARWVASSPAELGSAVTAITLAGDSAGGQMSAVAAIDLRDRPAAVPVIAQLLIYPATDLGTHHASLDAFAEGYLLTKRGMDWFAECYAADTAHPRCSPMRGPSLTGLPPAVIVTASLDPIRDQGRAYAAALIGAGVPVVFREAAGNIHGFITLRKAIPSAQGDVAGMLAAFKDLLVEAEANRVMLQAAA